MMIYVAILLIAFALVELDVVNLNKRAKLYFFVPLLIILILLSGLRPPGVDRDYDAYHRIYGYMKYLDWGDVFHANSLYQIEVGYVFLTKIFYGIGMSFSGFLFIYEILIGGLLGMLIYKYSPYPFTSLCIYVCLFFFPRNFTQIRFALSAILLLSGLLNLADNRKVIGWICLLLAGLIHNSGWIGLFIPLSYMLFYNRWIYLIFPPLGYIISFFRPIHIILSLVGLPEQISRYLTKHVDLGASMMSYVFCYILLIICVFHYNKLKELFGRKFEYLYISLSFSAFVGLMFINFPIMQRISGALFTVSIIFIPYLIKVLTNKKLYGYRDVFAFGVILVYFLYGIKLLLISHFVKPFF